MRGGKGKSWGEGVIHLMEEGRNVGSERERIEERAV